LLALVNSVTGCKELSAKRVAEAVLDHTTALYRVTFFVLSNGRLWLAGCFGERDQCDGSLSVSQLQKG